MSSIKITPFLLILLFFMFLGCNKTENKTTENTDNKQNVTQTSGKVKNVVIQCSGMSCTGCENTIKSNVKKIEGVKEVIADYNTNIVKASYESDKTNVKAIENAITNAGYKVESVKE